MKRLSYTFLMICCLLSTSLAFSMTVESIQAAKHELASIDKKLCTADSSTKITLLAKAQGIISNLLKAISDSKLRQALLFRNIRFLGTNTTGALPAIGDQLTIMYQEAEKRKNSLVTEQEEMLAKQKDQEMQKVSDQMIDMAQEYELTLEEYRTLLTTLMKKFKQTKK